MGDIIDHVNQEKKSECPLFGAREHNEKFDPLRYLDDFYKTAKEDQAMQIVLFFLPGIIYRLPNQIETVLDLGAGPTVYVPIVFRQRAKHIFTSDYAPANREVLKQWITRENTFDWSNVCEWIAAIEASVESPHVMQELTRSKMRGVLDVDIHLDPVIQDDYFKSDSWPQSTLPRQFDVVTSVFCLEYASETSEEYSRAVKSATSLIKPGGYLVQGGVLNANEYSFGERRFRCHYLTQSELLAELKKNNMSTNASDSTFRLIMHDEIFVLISKKKIE